MQVAAQQEASKSERENEEMDDVIRTTAEAMIQDDAKNDDGNDLVAPLVKESNQQDQTDAVEQEKEELKEAKKEAKAEAELEKKNRRDGDEEGQAGCRKRGESSGKGFTRS